MNTHELEELLEGGAETDRVDFKASCKWAVNAFAKDILALSNVRDGGYIIIGVQEKENSFERKGVDPEHKSTFNIDAMKDQISPYADPHVNFQVYFPKDQKGLEYVVIKVFQFEEVPVICSKDSSETKKATIYYRNRDRRAESAPISNSYDLRSVIDEAAVRMMRRMHGLGLSVEPNVKKKLDEELQGL